MLCPRCGKEMKESETFVHAWRIYYTKTILYSCDLCDFSCRGVEGQAPWSGPINS